MSRQFVLPFLSGLALLGTGGLGVLALLDGALVTGGLIVALSLVALGLAVALGVLYGRERARAGRGRDALVLLDGDDRARCVSDPRGRIVLANRAARDSFGDQDLLPWLERRLVVDLPEDREPLDRLKAALDRGLGLETELVLEEDGESRYVHISLEPSEAGDRRVWSVEDITSKRIIDDLLVREREELADFLFFLPVGLYSVDVDGRLCYVNQMLARWLGEEPGALVGLLLANLTDGPVPEPDGVWEGRLRFAPLNGPPFDGRVFQSTYDDAGRIRTRSVVLRPGAPEDLLIAEEPRNARERLWLFDEAPVGIALTDPEGAIVDCNASLLGLLGENRADVLDRPLASIAAPGDRGLLSTQAARVMAGDVARARCDVTLGHSGSERSAALLLSRMARQLSDPSDGLIVHLIDTTEQKNLEQQVAQAQKMQAMGQLAGGIAHDFNNLLTAMIGFSDLLLQRHGVGDPSFADLMQIRQNANRAANLVRQLLAFSRRQPLRPVLLNVTDALAELSHLLRRLLGERVSLRLQHSREPCYIRVDPGQFDQVIINLAVNARDAMPIGGGSVQIDTRVRKVARPVRLGGETMPPGEYVVIAVSDTGCGIPREGLGRIFEPFYTTKAEGTAGSGTGLGLSTVYGIVRQTEGYISVESTPGEGTTFTICLPRQEAAPRGIDARARTGVNRDGAPEPPLSGEPGPRSPARTAGARPRDLRQSLPEAGRMGQGRAGQGQMDPALVDPARADTARSAAAAPAGSGSSGAPARSDGPRAPEGGGSVDVPADLARKAVILFVEDEDAVRVFGSRALRNRGYEVHEARAGEGALETLAGGTQIDLLITDMVMPGMDGAELATRVCESHPDIPIILVSGYSEDVIRGDLMSRPNTHFLPKPFSLKALTAKVQEVLAGVPSGAEP
ncbi:ATP-binding protein [Phaeovibrio sulfidiphilus]|uniref:hybrid sensor histidine kinase/response regulator n=1 Tax=Phaeovibrio sulfidiphilus TaxID=1220600 RepID=UPI001F557C1A|nr:ATP-binding protein [Phaeovibrio sulfidiphilus]